MVFVLLKHVKYKKTRLKFSSKHCILLIIIKEGRDFYLWYMIENYKNKPMHMKMSFAFCFHCYLVIFIFVYFKEVNKYFK